MPNPLSEAEKIIYENLPGSKIQAVVDYEGLYLFRVWRPLVNEELMDPFYSVDQTTGEFAEFSILTDGDPQKITALFVQADKGG